MLSEIRRDLKAVRERDPAARSDFEVALVSSGFHALTLHRPAHWLYKRNAFLPARLISQMSRFLTGIEIHPGATIGSGVMIDHGMGVVIGETAEIGDGCTIYQGVTLGGTGKEKGKRHPTLGKNVVIGSGAKVLGPFKVGDGAKVAANAVVLESLPPDSTAVGVPARVVRIRGHRPDHLDHVHTPDPVSQELCRMRIAVERLEKRIHALEKTPDVRQFPNKTEAQ